MFKNEFPEDIDLRAYDHDIVDTLDRPAPLDREDIPDNYPPMVLQIAVYQKDRGWVGFIESRGGSTETRGHEHREDACNGIRRHLSQSYLFWDHHVSNRKRGDLTKDNQPIIRANGVHYTIGHEHTQYPVRGFAGRRFRFQLIDSEEVIESTNVWYQGQIPREFARSLPDNAIVLPSR